MTTLTLLDALKQRRAVRNYLPQEVEEEKIAALLEAATLALTTACGSLGIFMSFAAKRSSVMSNWRAPIWRSVSLPSRI